MKEEINKVRNKEENKNGSSNEKVTTTTTAAAAATAAAATAIELSLGGSSPYTSTDKINNNKYT